MEALFSDGLFLRESPGYDEAEQAGDGDFSGRGEAGLAVERGAGVSAGVRCGGIFV